MEFGLKVLFRIIHLASGSFLVGLVIADTIWEIPKPANYGLINAIIGVLLLVSGIVNIVLLSSKTSMGTLRTIWIKLIYTKFFFWLLLLPIPEIVAKQFQIVFPRRAFNQVIISLTLVVSVYTKQYRDWAVIQKIKSE
jgi:hypothetical protein